MNKTKIYDSFHCTASACPMTCCTGWSIRVEQENMEQWQQNPETSYVCKHTVCTQKDGETCYAMKLDEQKSCVLLNQDGLCELVLKHGDAMLSKTCAEFPRKCNEVIDVADESQKVLMQEYSMSSACPEVVSLIFARGNQSVVMLPDTCREKQPFPMEYRIRNMLIELLQDTDYEMQDKLLLGFSYLHECLSCEWEEEVDSTTEVYREEENQEETIASIETETCDSQEAFIELCQTFFDITEYYRLEPMYKPYLEEICAFIETMDEQGNFIHPGDGSTIDCNTLQQCWKTFRESFLIYDEKMINIMCSEIFSDCISDDLEFMIESYQSIIMEYVMIRFSLFLKAFLAGITEYDVFLKEEKFVIAYTSLYVRMIGHNVEGMTEYWEENFEDPVLDMQYLYLLLQ